MFQEIEFIKKNSIETIVPLNKGGQRTKNILEVPIWYKGILKF
ncbi:MAG: hypothetical protein ACI35W_06630 [Anaeroplasmataceae bacterium]